MRRKVLLTVLGVLALADLTREIYLASGRELSWWPDADVPYVGPPPPISKDWGKPVYTEPELLRFGQLEEYQRRADQITKQTITNRARWMANDFHEE